MCFNGGLALDNHIPSLGVGSNEQPTLILANLTHDN